MKKKLTKEKLDEVLRDLENAPKIKSIVTDEGREYFIIYRDKKGLHGQEEETEDT